MLPEVIAADNVSMTVSGALTDVTTCFSAAVDMITSNPIAMVFIGFALAAGGIRLFRKVRRG